MSGRTSKVFAILALMLIGTAGTAYAQEEHPPQALFRVAGEITAVVPEEQAFALTSRDGREVRIHTNERTSFRSRDGTINGLEDLEPGMHALVVGRRADDGKLLALHVFAGQSGDRPRPFRVAGRIMAVNPDEGVFALETRAGEAARIRTVERTEFLSRDGEIEDLSDLEPGMFALVVGVRPPDGLPVALKVAVRMGDQPGADIRFAGRILEVGDRAFAVMTRRGDGVRVFVNADTRFRSRSGEVDGIEDLEPGMPVVVGAVEQDGDGLLAMWVAVGDAKDRPGWKPGRGPGVAPGNPSESDIILTPRQT